jgi:hypothetical protein
MTDLTDFLNVVASAEDWAGFGAHEAIHHRRAGRASSADQGRLRQTRAKAVERAARCAGARVPRHVRAVPVAAVVRHQRRGGEVPL